MHNFIVIGLKNVCELVKISAEIVAITLISNFTISQENSVFLSFFLWFTSSVTQEGEFENKKYLNAFASKFNKDFWSKLATCVFFFS